MKSSDIRPITAMIGQEDAMDKDVAMLLDHADEFVTVSCPACEQTSRSHHFDRKGFSYWLCRACNTVYTCPRPSKELLKRFYAQSEVYRYWSNNVYEASAENRRRLIFRPRAKTLIEACSKAGLQGGTILEVGASQGFFCEEIRSHKFFQRIIAVEPTPDQARICREKGFEVYEDAFENVNLDTATNAIASFETIEHLFSPAEFMMWALKHLTPGGLLMLSLPNINGFETIVLGPESGAVDHEHLNYFSPHSMTILAERTGYENIVITTPGKLDVEIVQNFLASNRENSKKVDPFIYALVTSGNTEIDAAFQNLLQKANLSSNMLVLAQKPK